MDFKTQLDEACENEDTPYYWGIPAVVIELLVGAEEVEDNIVDTGRWAIYHETVYKHDGRYWMVEYSEPATENRDWDHEGYECYEVAPVEVTVTKYLRKE